MTHNDGISKTLINYLFNYKQEKYNLLDKFAEVQITYKIQ